MEKKGAGGVFRAAGRGNMLGAIIGDIVGSKYEFNNTKSKEFPFFGEDCRFTDDTVMTVAIAEAILTCGPLSAKEESLAALSAQAVACMRKYGRAYPHAGYGGMFSNWLGSEHPEPYNSFGNGAAMRISPVGFLARSEKEVKAFSAAVTRVTHDHPEGLKGAEAIAMAIFLALENWEKEDIFKRIARDYYPELKTEALSYPVLHEEYGWEYGQGSVTCQSSVPQAIVCFAESNGFEDAVRLAVSLGGDSDTVAAMTGGIAEAYYGIPREIERKSGAYLPDEFKRVVLKFRKVLNSRFE